MIIAGIRGTHRIKTFSGRIEVDATGQGASPELDLETFSGDLDSDVALTLRSTSRRNQRAGLPGGSGRTLNVKSFSGSLRLTR